MNTKIEILDKHNVLRRFLSPNPPYISFVKDDGTICSTCFQLRKGENGLSVDLEHLTTIEKSISDKSKYKLLKLNVGRIRNTNLNVEHDPIEDNYSHSLIMGNLDKKSSRQLASISSIL